MSFTDEDTIRCDNDGKEIPPVTSYVECEGSHFCDQGCHDEKHGGPCGSARDDITPAEPGVEVPWYNLPACERAEVLRCRN